MRQALQIRKLQNTSLRYSLKMPSKFYTGGVYVEERISDADWAVLQGH